MPGYIVRQEISEQHKRWYPSLKHHIFKDNFSLLKRKPYFRNEHLVTSLKSVTLTNTDEVEFSFVNALMQNKSDNGDLMC